jgi:hypothetical protein
MQALYLVFRAQADCTLTHTSHKDTEQSTIEASITQDGVTLTDSLIRWSPNEWPSVCPEIPHCLPIRCSGCVISLHSEHCICYRNTISPWSQHLSKENRSQRLFISKWERRSHGVIFWQIFPRTQDHSVWRPAVRMVAKGSNFVECKRLKNVLCKLFIETYKHNDLLVRWVITLLFCRLQVQFPASKQTFLFMFDVLLLML